MKYKKEQTKVSNIKWNKDKNIKDEFKEPEHKSKIKKASKERKEESEFLKDVVKIYHSNIEKTDFLEHYGVLGMRWGKGRKGDVRVGFKGRRRKKSKEIKISKQTREYIKSNPKLLYKNRKSYTRAELKDALEGFRMEKELASYRGPSNVDKGKKYLDDFLHVTQSAMKLYSIYTSPKGQQAREAFTKKKKDN